MAPARAKTVSKERRFATRETRSRSLVVKRSLGVLTQGSGAPAPTESHVDGELRDERLARAGPQPPAGTAARGGRARHRRDLRERPLAPGRAQPLPEDGPQQGRQDGREGAADRAAPPHQHPGRPAAHPARAAGDGRRRRRQSLGGRLSLRPQDRAAEPGAAPLPRRVVPRRAAGLGQALPALRPRQLRHHRLPGVSARGPPRREADGREGQRRGAHGAVRVHRPDAHRRHHRAPPPRAQRTAHRSGSPRLAGPRRRTISWRCSATKIWRGSARAASGTATRRWWR